MRAAGEPPPHVPGTAAQQYPIRAAAQNLKLTPARAMWAVRSVEVEIALA